MPNHPDYDHYRNALMSLRNPRGGSLAWMADTVDKLWGLKANLDDLVALFSQPCERHGCERFFANSVARYLEAGYTTKDLLAIGELKDHEGKPLLETSNDLFKFVEKRLSIDEALAAAKITDSEGRTLFRRDDYCGFGGGFEGIGFLLEANGTAQKVQELVDMRGKDGKSLFQTPRDIARFIEHNGTKSYAGKLAALRDHEGNQIFNEFDIGLFKEDKGTVRYARELSGMRDTSGQTVFSTGLDIVHFHDKKYGLNTARDFLSLKDSDGNTVFRDGRDLVNFLSIGGTSDEAKRFAAIADDNGRPYFNGYQISLLKANKVSVRYAASFAGQRLNAQTAAYYSQLGLKKDDTTFRNCNKPKALILYPTSDPPDFIGCQAFSEDDTTGFFRKIFEGYDVRLRAITTVEEMYHEIDKYHDVGLLILGGHGSRQSLTFGESQSKYGIKLDEKSVKLTPDTEGLADCLAKLPKDAVIFLDSCCNGEGEESGANLANHVAKCAPGRKVISATATFNAGKITIKQMFPLHLSILACYTYENCTYITNA